MDDPAPLELKLGLVVPKRHARRSVTRNLVKRQMRQIFQQRIATLAAEAPAGLAGWWVLRLKAPWDRQLFPSAASDVLRTAVRAELQQLLQRAVPPAPPRSAGAGGTPSAASALPS